MLFCRVPGSSNQANPGEEEDATQNSVNYGSSGYTALHKIHSAIYQTCNTEQGEDNTEKSFDIHMLSFLEVADTRKRRIDNWLQQELSRIFINWLFLLG